MDVPVPPSNGLTSRWLPLIRQLIGHVLAFLATIAGASGLVLVLLWCAPGDPIDMLPNAEEVRPVLEREWELDKPLPVRWIGFVRRAATGDLGTSLTYRPGAPVLDVIAEPALRSMTWFGAAMATCIGVSTALAALTVGRPSIVRASARLFSIAPLFLLAHLAVNGMNAVAWRAMNAGWIDRPAWFALPDQASPVRTALAIALLAVASGALTDVHGAIEDVLADILASPYVDHARARGADVWPHVLANLVAPVAGIATSRAAFFAGGLVVVEKVLLLNGAGAILWEAAQQRDYNVAMGITVLLATLVAGVRLVGDVIRAFANPRLAAGASR